MADILLAASRDQPGREMLPQPLTESSTMWSAPARLRAVIPPFVLLVLLVVLWFPAARAHNSGAVELNTEADEAAHYVTALMIREYVADGLGAGPREFAEQYYVHYPKVAFGIWPPAFHLLLAAWLLLTGPSVSSALLFMSLTTTAVAWVMFSASRRSVGVPLALAAAVWFATMPAVQAATSSVMMDMLCTLFMLSATVLFGRYLDTGRSRYAVCFAVLAAAAILTKYNALAMALVPPLAVAVSRQWSVLRRRSFWAMPAIVAALCAPWYIFQWNMVQYAAEPLPSLAASLVAAPTNTYILAEQLGWLTLPLAGLGIYASVVRRHKDHGTWSSLLALLSALWVFHSFAYPLPESRYALGGLAALASFTAAGLHCAVRQYLRSERLDVPNALRLAAAIVAVVSIISWTPPARFTRGFTQAADRLLRGGARADVTTLVSSDAVGEGAFVAHVATHERQRQTIILRGTKLLANGSWMFDRYATRYADAAAVLTALDRARVEYVVMDDQPAWEHHRQLDTVVRTSPEWQLVDRIPSTRTGHSDVRIYGRTRPLPPGKRQFELNTLRSLGYNIRAQ